MIAPRHWPSKPDTMVSLSLNAQTRKDSMPAAKLSADSSSEGTPCMSYTNSERRWRPTTKSKPSSRQGKLQKMISGRNGRKQNFYEEMRNKSWESELKEGKASR